MFFASELAIHTKWPRYQRFSFSISPANEYSGLISFRTAWFDLLAIQGIVKSLLQHHSSKVSVLHIRWPKYWSFSFNISPCNEYSGLISCRMDKLDLLAVQGTLKSLLQHHSSKPSILRHSAFFIVQLSHPYTTTGKTIALTRRTFIGKVMSLLFNMLSRFVIAFLPRSKRLLISWLLSLSTVILEPKKIKSAAVSTFSLSIYHEVMGLDAIILVLFFFFLCVCVCV